MSEEKPLFPLGQILCTPLAWKTLKEHKADIPTLLKRHEQGDWDNMNGEDNSFSIEKGYMVCSSYVLATEIFEGFTFNIKIWVITEGDRSTTMILSPEEYNLMY
jgi:hypothetical protein